MSTYTVYKIFRPNTEDLRSYIGITKRTLNKRLKAHMHSRVNPLLISWIKKHFNDINIVSLYTNLSLEEALMIESKLVPKYECERKALHLLNLTAGGGLPKQWDELTDEEKKNRRNLLSLKLKGKKRSLEQKQRISRGHVGIKYSEEAIQRRIESLKNSKKLNRNFKLISPFGEEIIEKNLTSLCEKYKLNQKLISSLDKNGRKQHKLWSKNGIGVHVFADDKELYATTNLAHMANYFNIRKSGLSKLVKEKIKEYKKWTYIGLFSNIDLCKQKNIYYEKYVEYLNILANQEKENV
jgi:hypothetical protein